MKQLEPHLGVFLFVVGSFFEDGCYLHIAVFLGFRCIVRIFVAGLRFAGKCNLQISFGFCSFKFFHVEKFCVIS